MTFTLTTAGGTHTVSDEDAQRIAEMDAIPGEAGARRMVRLLPIGGREIRVFAHEFSLTRLTRGAQRSKPDTRAAVTRPQ